MGEKTPSYKTIELTEGEKRLLDGERLKPGDIVLLGGYVPELGPAGFSGNPAFDLIVNGVTHYHWVFWDAIPERLKERLRRA